MGASIAGPLSAAQSVPDRPASATGDPDAERDALPTSTEDLREVMLALKRARDEADRRALETEVMLEILETVLRPLSPARLLVRILRLLRRVIPFQSAVVLHQMPGGGLTAVFSSRSGLIGGRWPQGRLFDRVLSGQVVNVLALGRAPDWRDGPAAAAQLPGAGLLLPLYGDVSGILVLASAVVGGFGEEIQQTGVRFAVLARQVQANLEVRDLRARHETLAREKEAAELARAESDRRQQTVETILGAIPVGVYLRDPRGRFRAANPSAARLLGLGSSTLVGLSTETVFHGTLAPLREEEGGGPSRVASATDTVQELEVPSAEGVRVIGVSKSRVSLFGEEVVVGTVQDLTPYREAERAITEAKEAAEAANRAKSEFIATMSHEIRTPLNGILGMAQAMLASPQWLAPAHADAFKVIQSSGDLLLGLIDNVLNIAKIEAGKLEIVPTETDLGTLVHDTTLLWAERARAHSLDLFRIMDGSIAARIRVDGLRLRQILNNLIGNAIKFTEFGFVLIRVSMQRTEAGSATLTLQITDTGPGIPEDKQPLLFRRFIQVGDRSRRSQQGTGLGLAICSDLVKLMGGQITVDSRPGHGAAFTVSLPVGVVDARPRFRPTAASLRVVPWHAKGGHDPLIGVLVDHFASMGGTVLPANRAATDVHGVICHADDLAEALPAIAGGDGPIAAFVLGHVPASFDPTLKLVSLLRPLGPLSVYDALDRAFGLKSAEFYTDVTDATGPHDIALPQGRVLVAEDNIVNQQVVRSLLNGPGLELRIVANGALAVSAALSWHPDAVLMDVHMPELDGMEAARQLRAQGFARPIIAFTANILPEAVAQCRDSGMEYFLRKPVERTELLQTLRSALARTTSPVLGRTADRAAAPEPPHLALPEAPNSAPTRADGQTRRILDRTTLSELRQVVGEQNALRIVGSFLGDGGRRIDAVLAAIDAGDAGEAASQCHSIKSTAATVGAAALSALAAYMEAVGRSGDMAALQACAGELRTVFARTRAALTFLSSGTKGRRTGSAEG